MTGPRQWQPGPELDAALCKALGIAPTSAPACACGECWHYPVSPCPPCERYGCNCSIAWPAKYRQLSLYGDGILLLIAAMRERGFNWHVDIDDAVEPMHFWKFWPRHSCAADTPGAKHPDLPAAVALAAAAALGLEPGGGK